MFLDIATVNDVFEHVSTRGPEPVLLFHDAHAPAHSAPAAAWKPISSAQLYGRVHALADILTAWGIGRGDRVAIIAENRWEWIVTDFAVLAIAAVDVPLYPTLTADHVGYMLRDSGARAVFVSSAAQYAKILAAGDLPHLEHIVVMDPGDFPKAESFAALMAAAPGLETPDPAFDARVRAASPADLATIIYTSGTTGEPKGVMLTHGNLASNISVSTVGMGIEPKDRCISFLPLSHVTARHTDYAMLAQGVCLAYCPKFDQLPPALQAVHPTIFLAVPRVYEKIRHAVQAKSAPSPLKSRILAWALAVGRRHRDATLAGTVPTSLQWKLADKLVFSKIHEAFGGKARVFISGGAPLGMESAGWFADTGTRIFEGYGLTETSPVIAVNNPQAHRIGTVGKPLRNVQCRLADDGELEVRGPSIFPGYWNKPDQTRDAFTPDGWFKTGDIGALDADGFLSITDRKKELLKTSGGKLIAPQPIENKLKAHTLIAEAALVGDRHKFACVLLCPNFPALEAWAAREGLPPAGRAALVQDPRVVDRFRRIVDETNATLAPYESMKRCHVVPDEWSVEDGTLTPSLKLKRRVLEQRYAAAIADFYKDEATATR